MIEGTGLSTSIYKVLSTLAVNVKILMWLGPLQLSLGHLEIMR